MARHQLEVFATTKDLLGVLQSVERETPIKYALLGQSSTRDVTVFASAASAVGTGSTGEVSRKGLLVVDASAEVAVREIPQRDGSVRYGVDQLENPCSVVLRPGGMMDPDTLLAGQIGTASDDPGSLRLFSGFSRGVKRQFAKVKSYWVGMEASSLLDRGGRLTADVRSPPEYDLRR